MNATWGVITGIGFGQTWVPWLPAVVGVMGMVAVVTVILNVFLAAVHPAAPPEPESLLPPAHRQHGRHRRAAGQPASQLVAKSVNKSVSLLVCQLVRLSVSQSVS